MAVITRGVRHSCHKARQLQVLSWAQSQTDSTASFASNSFYKLCVTMEKESGGGGIGTEGLGQSSSAPEAQMGVPYGGTIEWGSLE